MARTGSKQVRGVEEQIPLFAGRPIYGGDAIPYNPQQSVPGNAPRPARKAAVRKTKMSAIMIVVITLVGGCLFYTSTVISVIRLGREMNELTVRYNTVISTNEVLRAEINRKSNLERITLLARDKAGLINPHEAPTWFEIDPARVH